MRMGSCSYYSLTLLNQGKGDDRKSQVNKSIKLILMMVRAVGHILYAQMLKKYLSMHLP